MPLHRLTRADIIRAVTKSPSTKHFRHLLPVNKHLKRLLKFPHFEAFSKKVVPEKDRIKYWNVVPGDQVRIRGDRNSTLHEVVAINKFRNRVFVRNTQSQTADQTGRPKHKNYHYSRCQLFLGEYELPSTTGESVTRNVPVFAKRLGTTSPVWNTYLHRYQWTRFARKTVPVLPDLGEKIDIPWPKHEPRLHAEATIYDTSKEEVAKVTYKPPPFSPTLKGLIPKLPTERQFLRAVFNPHHTPFYGDAQPPVEMFLSKELSNPHSRAKKQERWQQYKVYKKDLLKQYIDTEIKANPTRLHSELKAEAEFKWKQKLEEEKSQKRKERWVASGYADRMQTRVRRKARKAEKERQRLTELTLEEAPNQVIPKETTA
ncbi:hypothetical protein K435DRAFT_849954 [Dendrothele bispora CBS 962.96]|uniref:KOW domain-containing protein n=1 Tax=Dendrothele bispora (strain CBS 962.96) TaxID=1314807 RepID=A0A4S8MQP6_DENBC|nr:hypothetical protein K435DRAFT_849954 [Dendrothele bispora CBS 962.96]